MKEDFKIVHYTDKHKAEKCSLSDFTEEKASSVIRYHESFKEYSVTPLRSLNGLAKTLGIGSLFVKDESYRFGLNAFKVLGGSYAIGRYIAEKTGIEPEEMTCEKLICEDTRKKAGDITFITATDGNHGRGVAWTAKILGQKCIVYMPVGSAESRLNNIKLLGAKASITDMNYDDTVRFVAKEAKENGYCMVQDTAFENYQKIPLWIMQGYMTMAYEAVRELKEIKPTHVFIQAGVGSMAGAVTAFMSSFYGDDRPVFTIVEPNKADCFYRTAKADDGKRHFVTDDMRTIMAGLACGEPCTIGWNILRSYADNFISVPDYVSADGIRILANPIDGDEKVISGESGSVTTGLIYELMTDDELKDLRDTIGLDSSSKVLCFSTEGMTDPVNYRKIVWDGAYSRF